MTMIAGQPTAKLIKSALANSANVIIPTDRVLRRHQVAVNTLGGAWTFLLQASYDDGVTWFDASQLLSLGAGTSGHLYATGLYSTLRCVCTRTGGTVPAIWYQAIVEG